MRLQLGVVAGVRQHDEPPGVGRLVVEGVLEVFDVGDLVGGEFVGDVAPDFGVVVGCGGHWTSPFMGLRILPGVGVHRTTMEPRTRQLGLQV